MQWPKAYDTIVIRHEDDGSIIARVPEVHLSLGPSQLWHGVGRPKSWWVAVTGCGRLLWGVRREKVLLRLLPASATALTHVPCAFCDADRFPAPQERPIYSNS